MAKASVIIRCAECGCEFKHEKKCYNRAEAESYQEWATDHITVCPDCYRKAQAAAKKAAARKAMLRKIMQRAWAIARTLVGDTSAKLKMALKQAWAEIKADFAELTGSEKQIAWAKSIREKAVATIIKGVKAEAICKAKQLINSKTSASWWIDNRFNFDTARMAVACLSK